MMQKVISTLTALTLALGLAVATQAQTVKTPEKPAVKSTQPAQPQVAPQEAAKPGDVTKEAVKPGHQKKTKKAAKKAARKKAKQSKAERKAGAHMQTPQEITK
jgi:hypothetical protein